MLQELASSEHQAHEALKSTQSRLVQTEKMASLGHLVAGVAHEINNPLSFVSNNVAVLERDLNDLLGLIELYRQGEAGLEKAQPDLIEKINDLDDRIDLNYSLSNLPRLIERTREGLRRIERIVKELRLFARVDEGDWNEVDLNPGIESSINMVKGYARKRGVRIVMDLGALPTIRCRAARIHQVIVNLLTNAIDACAEETGVVTVHTETEPEVMGVRIDIQDNGCGIDAAIRERIFDPFFTTKPVGQGTGLGLSISYGIIEEHDGRIEVHSSPGEGSRFTIHLPIEPRRKLREESVAGHLQPRWPHPPDASFDPIAQGRSRAATAARIPGRLFRRARTMKLGLINSAWVQAGRGTSYGIWKTREIGFDSIDIFADPLDIDEQERTLIRRECAAAGLPIISVACVAVGLIDFNPSVQRFHLEPGQRLPRHGS